MARLSSNPAPKSYPVPEVTQSAIPPRRRPRGILLLIVIVAAGLAVWGGYGWSRLGAKPEGWQAVFLNNGQAYFGQLRVKEDLYILEKVFYLRTNPNSDQAPPPTAAFDIVKRGGEPHGPEGTIYIPKEAVLFWETLRGDSEIVRVIEDFFKSGQGR